MNDRNHLNERMGELLYRAFLQIRSRAWIGQDSGVVNEEIAALADLLHNIPRWMVGHDEQGLMPLDPFRQALTAHVRRFYPKTNPDDHEFLRILNMTDEEFEERYPRQSMWQTEPDAVHA